MQNNHYQVYLKSVFDLAASIVIKCHENAVLVNARLDAYVGPGLYNEYDPKTWKYYLNLCGEYHSTDTIMTVTSVDSLQEIQFTKENLKFHRATAQAYAFGTKQYRELASRYPKQTQLIHGILYPADLETVVDAEDMNIVSYAPEFVLEQEVQLMPQLREWLRGYFARVIVGGFIRSDELFLAGVYSDLADHMVPQILLLRARAMKTRYAHNYHIHQYLSSHSDLGKHMDLMTGSQAAFFYRNIRYIEHNSGNGENFNWLIENVMTARSLPIASFSSGQDTSEMPEKLAPTPVFRKKPLNTVTNIDAKNDYSLSEMLDLQEKVAEGNALYREEIAESNLFDIQYSKQNQTTTKVLESTVIDYTDSERTRWSDVAARHWLSLSQKDLYTAFINFEIPSSGESVSISVKDAFCLYTYCLIAGLGRDIPKLPLVNAMKVARTPHPTLADLREVTSRVSDEELMRLYELMPMVRRSISVEDFFNQTRDLFVSANAQWSEVSGEEHMIKRGQKEAAACRLWCMEVYQLGDHPDQLYSDWFRERNLDMSPYEPPELMEIAEIIVAKATGAEYNDTVSLKAIQRSMVDMLIGLSSYSIQIGASINTGPVIYAGNLQLRIGDFDGDVGHVLQVETDIPDVTNIQGTINHDVMLDILEGALDDKVTGTTQHDVALDLPSLIGVCGITSDSTGVTSPIQLSIGVGCTYTDLEPLPEPYQGQPNIPDMAAWYRLTEEQRAAQPTTYKVELS